MPLITETFDLLKAVNECQVSGLEKAAALEIEPATSDQFHQLVRNAECAVVHTYQVTAFAAIQESDPQKVSTLWKDMVDFCDSALKALKELNNKYPTCGASEVYNVTLDYRAQAH